PQLEWLSTTTAGIPSDLPVKCCSAGVGRVAEELQVVPEHQALANGHDEPNVAILRHHDPESVAILGAVTEHRTVSCAKLREVDLMRLSPSTREGCAVIHRRNVRSRTNLHAETHD